VHLDGCVEVEAAYYSLPPGWIGRPVKVQWDALHVRILHPNTNQLLREHLRQKRGGYRIEEQDHPKKMPLSTAQLLRRAAHAGTQTGKFCQLLYDRQGETSIRRILGVLSLLKKYGVPAVEDACAVALESDELTRRGDRLLERRRKQAQFRDPQVSFDNFDFDFNKRMNRNLDFDLATAAFVARHDDALF